MTKYEADAAEYSAEFLKSVIIRAKKKGTCRLSEEELRTEWRKATKLPYPEEEIQEAARAHHAKNLETAKLTIKSQRETIRHLMLNSALLYTAVVILLYMVL